MKTKLMTKILTFMIFFLSIISFTSCSTNNYEATYLTNTNVNVKDNDITLITSKEQLNEYRESSRFLEAENNVVTKIESYSSDFFDEKMLIVINLKEITGSSKISVKKIDYVDSEVIVTLKRKIPDIADDSMKIWSIFIEVKKQEINSVKYIFQ